MLSKASLLLSSATELAGFWRGLGLPEVANCIGPNFGKKNEEGNYRGGRDKLDTLKFEDLILVCLSSCETMSVGPENLRAVRSICQLNFPKI